MFRRDFSLSDGRNSGNFINTFVFILYKMTISWHVKPIFKSSLLSIEITFKTIELGVYSCLNAVTWQ